MVPQMHCHCTSSRQAPEIPAVKDSEVVVEPIKYLAEYVDCMRLECAFRGSPWAVKREEEAFAFAHVSCQWPGGGRVPDRWYSV